MRQLTRWFMFDGLGGDHPAGGVLRRDGTPKAEYHALRKLIRETWSTDWKGPLQPDGAAAFRGYFGTYEVEAGGFKGRHVRLHVRDSPKQTVRLEKA